MSADEGVPKCRQCGYLLVGFPPPRRCPECGALPVRRAAWVESELHLEGPRVVLPVMLRCLTAAILMVGGLLVTGVLGPDFLQAMKVPLKVDQRWTRITLDLCMVLTTVLWSRPMPVAAARDFGLDRASRARHWLVPLQLPWLVHVALLLTAIDATRQGKPVDAMTVRVTLVVGVLAQASWLLSMRHAARIADYLKDGLVRRMVSVWTWVWPIVSLLVLGAGWVGSRYGTADWPDGTLSRLWTFSNLGVLLGCGVSVMLAWTMAQCLTMAHETMASEQRRARREAERYHTPK